MDLLHIISYIGRLICNTAVCSKFLTANKSHPEKMLRLTPGIVNTNSDSKDYFWSKIDLSCCTIRGRRGPVEPYVTGDQYSRRSVYIVIKVN